MLNIDYVISINLDGNSGKEKASREKAFFLKKKGKNVKIYSLHNKKNAILACKLISMFFLEIRYLFLKLINRNKPDIIFTRSFFEFGTYIVGKTFNIPVIRELHADFQNEAKILFKNNPLMLFFSKIYGKYELFFIKKSNGLIFNNERLEKYAHKMYGLQNIHTIAISNGCNTEQFYHIEKKYAREMLNLSKDQKYLLFIGSISKWHGVEFLLKMQEKIHNQNSEINLLLVGGANPDYLNYLKKNFQSKGVLYTGSVEYEKALLYINAADICLVSVNDIRISPGSPIKLFDYISCGCPVIVQEKTEGYSDIVEKYNIGATTNFSDSEKASYDVQQFLGEANFTYYLNNNRKVALESLNWNNIITQWLKFSEKLLVNE